MVQAAVLYAVKREFDSHRDNHITPPWRLDATRPSKPGFVGSSPAGGTRIAIFRLLRPGDSRHDARQRPGLDVGHQLPDRVVGEEATVRRHAACPTVKNRMKQRSIFSSVAPAPVCQAWPGETESARAMATVAIHRTEEQFSLLDGARVFPDRVDESRGRGR